MGVLTEQREDGIVIVRMNWPEKRNALGPDDTREVGDAIESAAATARLGVVLTGAGAFCAGGDLEQFAALSATVTQSELRNRIYDNVHSVLRAIRTSPVPVVAAVDGPAIGLGLDYALACDMCFVGPSGWMQHGWALAGLIHGAGGSAFIQRAAGPQFWKLVAEQERIDGRRAAELGFGESCDCGAVDASVARLARLAHLSSAVLAAYTDLYRRERWASPEYFDRCADYQSQFIGSPEFRATAATILAERAIRGSNQSQPRRPT
jgi:enoyl-CoA hydratase/carnithine racemase